MSVDLIGWIATGFFVGSYFLSPKYLRLVQASAAVLWMIYGVMLGAKPVIIANILVFCAAVYSSIKAGRQVERSKTSQDSRVAA